ncbi:MAG: hypothetical protein J5J00_10170 [Deltaproteobacteria bacterium]|nr:hypothetical protein [Deltaproteobacteria bacterium]
MANTIRAKVDSELTRHVGKWFTVRQIQDKLRINPSTLKPLIMKYARERVLRRRHVKGTARSVEFSPAAGNTNAFKQLLVKSMPYRNFSSASRKSAKAKVAKKSSSSKRSAKRARR